MIQVEKKTRIAREVLDTHAQNLETEFTTFEDFQALFIDVFGNNLGSLDNLANLKNKFADGTLRPEVKFVSSEALIDAQGIARGAAFDQQSQTILLSEDLDAAGIESSIEQEIGHWWDVQLNGTKDTTTLDGKAFDEGTAYAERFSEGVNGDNIFSDLVYQNDFYTILVNGQETEVEFRPIATWNIQGNTFNNQSTLEEVFNIMENPGQGQGPIEIMALQEVTFPSLQQQLRNITGVHLDTFESNFQQDRQLVQRDSGFMTFDVNVFEYNFERNGINYRVYYNNNIVGDGNSLGTAIVLRNPPEDARPIARVNPDNPDTQRGYIGVETPEGYYFSVHAQSGSGLNRNNNAQTLLNDIRNIEGLDENLPVFILGDFNRNIADTENENIPDEIRPFANIDQAFPTFADENVLGLEFIRLNDFTRDARAQTPSTTLDYMFSSLPPDRLGNGGQGIVLNELPNARTNAFPSDHFPVLYDDGFVSLNNNPTVTVQYNFPDAPTLPLESDIAQNVSRGTTEFETEEYERLLFFDIEVFGSGPQENRISFEVEEENYERLVPRSLSSVELSNGNFGQFNGYTLEFENLAPIEDVILDEDSNFLGLEQSDIEFGDNFIQVNVGGESVAPGIGFDLLVEFDTSGFGL